MKLVDILVSQIRSAAEFNTNVQAALPLLQSAMPELVVLGEYDPTVRQGPSIPPALEEL